MTTSADSRKVLVGSMINRKIISFIFLIPIYCLLSTVFYLLSTAYCFAEEPTDITAESLEYHQETSTYIAKGNVKIRRGDTLIEADEMTYNRETSDTIATGNVKYNDAETSMSGSKAELNLDKKTGVLYDAEILYKKENYRITGKVIEKKGEDYYVSPEATFTTCDPPSPSWCFKGKRVDAVTGDRLKAQDVSFRIKGIPVLYTPYLWTPITAERKTGFLIPDIGYSDTRGFSFNIPFFWAIAENRDATFHLDHYSKRGFGEGLEYRYLEPGDIKGRWWVYHLRDSELKKDFFEVKGVHDQRSTEKIGGYLNVNFINEDDYYREFNTHIEARTNRFLESTGEVMIPLTNSRAYLLSQYWIDLKENSPSSLQRLPEAGFVLNPVKVGSFYFSGVTTLANFWREEGIDGQRFDIFPKILHSFGKDMVVSQSVGLRETAYSLHRADENSLHREAFEYNLLTHTRLSHKYASFTHVIEPSLGYTFITNSENDITLFDSVELYKKTSAIELSFLNRFINRQGEFITIRASQAFDTERGDRPFLPLLLEVGIKRPLSIRLAAAYNVHNGNLEGINSDFSGQIAGITLSLAQRYQKSEDIKTFVAGIGIHPYKPFYLSGRIWYDAAKKETKETALILKYLSQCWGMSIEAIKNPDDFHLRVLFELKGLGFRKIQP
jgi:LPS-assembly protein